MVFRAVAMVDVHQHLWPEEVLAVLERRRIRPRAVWASGHWDLRLCGEPSSTVRPVDHDVGDRAARLGAYGIERAVLALSPPAGLEGLGGKDGAATLEAWDAAARHLPPQFGWWGAVSELGTEADLVEQVRGAAEQGAAGICLAATRLATPDSATRVLPILEAACRAGLAVFVHPGPAQDRREDPAWWSSATSYVAQQHAAWHAFHAFVRPYLPGLCVIFALLAGLAPLHVERSKRKGGASFDGALTDPLCLYETSSYGTRAISAIASIVGRNSLLYGSDYPVSPIEGSRELADLGIEGGSPGPRVGGKGGRCGPSRP